MARNHRLRCPAVIGTLMNMCWPTEPSAPIALEKGVISARFFAALVLMVLFTTFMVGPAAEAADRGTIGLLIDEDLDRRLMSGRGAWSAD